MSHGEQKRVEPGLTGDEEAERLVLELAGSLHRNGTPAHRLEQVLGAASERLGIEGQFFAVPTAVFAAFGRPGRQHAGLLRLEPGGVDLCKLSRLDDTIKHLASGRRAVREALDEVHAIVAAPPYFRAPAVVACTAISSGIAARFFGGGALEIALGAAIGLVVGVLDHALSASRARHLSVPLCAAVVAALARVSAWLVGPCLPEVVTLAGLLYLLPGLTLTIATTELSTGHLVAGGARMTQGVLVLLELAFGVAIGAQVFRLLPPPAAGSIPHIPLWVDGGMLLAAALCYAVLFQARPRDMPWIVVMSAVAYFGARLGAHTLGPQLGACVGAAAVGVGSNAWGRIKDRPPMILLVPAILLLVPGSVGFRSMTWLLRDEAVKAVDTAFDMALVATGLAVGLVLANAVLPPRRGL